MELEKLQSLRLAGILLPATALFAALLMHNHPHGGDGAGIIRWVHGGLLAMIIVQPAVLALLGRALGWNMLTALALASFSFGSLGAVLAGTINGFVVPTIAAYPAGEIGPGVAQLAWEMNQALATNGAVAAGLGIALFGAALWRASWRVIGALGVLAGAVPAALLVAGATDMRFYGAMFTYITQLLWLAGLGGVLAREAGRAG